MIAMNIVYRKAQPEDAAKLLEYLKAVGSESNNLTFGANGIPLSVEQEAQLLENMANSEHSALFIAVDGDEIVANGCIEGSKNPRFRHRCNLAISVRKPYWGMGIGSGMMKELLRFAKNARAELISLEVRSDNERAKALYRKFGFEPYGTFPHYFKLGNEYFDVDCMTLSLV